MKLTLFPAAAFLQFEVQVERTEDNLQAVRFALQGFQAEKTTLIVLPELWASGFDYEHAEELAEKTPDLLAELTRLAEEYNVYFAGSLLEKKDGRLYNTLFVSGPEGIVGSYRKQHLFSFWKEDAFFSPGCCPVPIATPHGLLAALVCYDLRFPELARSQVFQGAELIVVSAQWPALRLDHWQTLLQARAIENQAYLVACNGCGRSGDIDMAGHSMIIGPDGTVLEQGGSEPLLQAASLDQAALEAVRGRFCSVAERPYLDNDADNVVDLSCLLARLAPLRKQGSRIAFTNGCFDILHAGHVDYLEKARKTADCLVLGLNSDVSVKRIKGESRPVNSEGERARVLAALASVDFVVIFEEDTPLHLITEIMPDVLVKGADWPEDKIVGGAEVKAAGGIVARIDFHHETSTSGIIKKAGQKQRKRV